MHPFFRGSGCRACSEDTSVDRIVVSTGAENVPAKRLYRSLGFEETREGEAVPGLRITFFEKPLWGSR